MPALKKPNILITGTPGVGKSTLCDKLAEKLNFEWHDISKIAKENDFIESYDEDYECPVIDEEKLLDYLEPIITRGGNIIEYHGCDFFPERFFDIIYVIRCNNTILYDRLKERNYNEKKLRSNIECEIFQTILDEAKDSYDESIVFELKCETTDDVDNNVKLKRQ
ncbi:adenylate kinase isoenzyme 6 homolog isoform X2 [Condylostylus longicornis]|uniref:adenylate kinase isoenzyme 6 homolog isoform X2 n=1 Tax=Condylostylus longicornis TaxID=2530218 RepID=UPI00244DF555|nr:adenylate kinase isoenzyme 6 homolog isoform X2 [Condylostylus longicornis]